jgi:hypothetical protein
VLLGLVGARSVVTGKNFPGRLGRGFTPADDLRLQRAPSIFFRVIGAVAASAGLTLLAISFLAWLPADAPGVLVAFALGLTGLGFAGTLGCLGWLLVVGYRHRMFRWNKP